MASYTVSVYDCDGLCSSLNSLPIVEVGIFLIVRHSHENGNRNAIEMQLNFNKTNHSITMPSQAEHDCYD